MSFVDGEFDWELIVARFGEIGLKSDPVRKRFLDKLVENIVYSLKKEGIDSYKIKKTRGRIFIELDEINKGLKALSFVSGVVSYSPAIKTGAEKEVVVEKATQLAKKYINNSDSFAVKTNRVGSHDYTSLEINEAIGDEVREETNAKVDLDDPDKVLYIDIRNNDSYVFKQKIEGMLGLPTGVQGNVVSLFSGGIDSPVAASRFVKRGCYVTPIYIKKGRYSSKKELERAKEVGKKFSRYIPKQLEFVVIDLEPVFEEINKHGDRYSCLLCKRAMYRAAEQVATQKNYSGIVTGESLGQVASQTLDNLEILNETTSKPIYRPLIGFDKVEIEQLSRKLGLLETSSQNVGGCPILPNKVKTKGDIDEIKKLERELDLIKQTKELAKNREKIVFE